MKLFVSLLFLTLSMSLRAQETVKPKSFFNDGDTYINLNLSLLLDSKLIEVVGGNTPTSGKTEGELAKDLGFSAAIGRSFPISDKYGAILAQAEFIRHPTKDVESFDSFEFENEFNTTAYMANFHWLIPVKTFDAFIGGGLGATKLTLKTTPINNPSFPNFEQSSNGFAYQFQTGVIVPIGKIFIVNAGYRIFIADNINSNVTDPESGEKINISWDLTTHRFEIGVGVKF
ncbi:outer membrane protein [uncultured Psychroserpens sp.]|uniref:outer membrane protein n=1 Tax=uncultured Psychroserpens sp. TaxID=255436 RepID=UPI002601CF1A|nr:outer membrane beta-barrel protein [uncultured Psychroserpens sp.]